MFVGLVSYAFTGLQGDERSRMLAALYFILAQIPFWALFEQAGSSLNLFTVRLVDREILAGLCPDQYSSPLMPVLFFCLHRYWPGSGSGWPGAG